MNSEPIFVAKPSAADIVFMFIIVIVLGIGCCWSLYFGLASDVYPQLIPLLFSVLLGLMACLIFFSSAKLDRIKLYEDRFEVISILGHIKKIFVLMRQLVGVSMCSGTAQNT